MKKLFSLFALMVAFFFTSAFAPKPSSNLPHNAKTMIVNLNGHAISYYDLANMSTKEYQQVTGNKLNLFEKIAFKKTTKQLRKSIAEDGSIKETKFTKMMMENDSLDGFLSDFHIGGFALGLFLGPIGVLIAYLLKEGPTASRRKWSWIGLVFFILLGGFILF